MLDGALRRKHSGAAGDGGTGLSRYRISPVSVKAARAWVFATHRHLPDVRGGLFAVAVKYGDAVVAVGMTSRPPRVWEGTGRIVISRVASLEDLPGVRSGDGREHAAPAVSMIYGALCRAARCLGWVEAWSYTLPDEDGRSLRAAGFEFMGWTKGEEWAREGRARSTVDASPKGRWMRTL